MNVPEPLRGMQHRAAKVEEVVPDKREILLRVAPYEIESDIGGGIHETFGRGCFGRSARDPSRVPIRMEHNGPLVGRSIEIPERDDALWVRARIASTRNGDDALTLVGEDILGEASVEFATIPEAMSVIRRGDQIHVRHRRAQLCGVALVPLGAHVGTHVEMVRAAQRDLAVEQARLWLEAYKTAAL